MFPEPTTMTFTRTTMAALILAAVAPQFAIAQDSVARDAGTRADSTTYSSADSTANSTANSTADSITFSSTDSSAVAKPEQSSKPGLDFSGLLFGNYQISTGAASKAANGGKAPNKFDIGRAYLNFRMPAGDRFSVRVTTDVKQQNGSSGAYDGWIVRLKYAYLQADVAKSSDPDGFSALARVGMLHNVVIDHQQEFWPRYLNRVATELYGFFASADLGVAAQLELPGRAGEIYATLVNGSGYEHPESDRFKDFAARVSLTPLGRSDGFLRTFTISPVDLLREECQSLRERSHRSCNVGARSHPLWRVRGCP